MLSIRDNLIKQEPAFDRYSALSFFPGLSRKITIYYGVTKRDLSTRSLL